ncbi:Nuclear pore glycoprotein p62 [Camponotus floridanus]|uniref:Nuclear pore glycoprotein p62 n=2 Tax=Camponotus floridanus TaxID=104421 RepID=E2AU26_CAMFO|nr:Nuclear pore glycoprotein p62 [Camponotus floridanus]
MTPGLSFDASKTGYNTTTTATTGFPLATTTAGFNFGVGTSTTSSTFLNKTTSAPISTSLTAPSTHTSLGTTTTVSSVTGIQSGAINFCQLEESINKWTLDLEEQEKVFVNQATQINAWDKLLITNGEKIVTLNQEVERVKIEQQQLEHELDYVVGQQKELQECLIPLEKELASLSVSDSDREYTYRLSENLDTQLKRMSEDLKEIIEHLNEANRAQDSSDPIVQIGKILNAHMNSLQWLDQQTALLTQKIQHIDQMHQSFRQESEQNLHLAYN